MNAYLVKSDETECKALGARRALSVYNLGMQPFRKVRLIQQQLVTLRALGQVGDCVLFCEHEPTISIGKRATEDQLRASVHELALMGVEVVHASRGGGITYHGPGQLMIYPVLSLRDRKIGVRNFVQLGLDAISEELSNIGLSVSACLNPAGVWAGCDASNRPPRGRKIAAVGLRISRGVTDHGFCLNVDCKLDIYDKFSPCFVPELVVTSVAKEFVQEKTAGELDLIRLRLIDGIANRLGDVVDRARAFSQTDNIITRVSE